MGGACSLHTLGSLPRGKWVGGDNSQNVVQGPPEMRSLDQTKVLPSFSPEEVLVRERAQERERQVSRTVDIIWTHFDADGNGELDPREFAVLVTETMAGGGCGGGGDDAGGGGTNFTHSEIDDLVHMIDTDGSGSISRSEFKELIIGLTGLSDEKRDEIASLSVLMCKAMMFVEAVVNQSKAVPQDLGKADEELRTHQVEKEIDIKVQDPKCKPQEFKELDGGCGGKNNQGEGRMVKTDDLSSRAFSDFSWRPRGRGSEPTKVKTEGKNWEDLPV